MNTYSVINKKPLWMRCGACTHEWIGIWTPMTAQRASVVMGNATCPACGQIGRDIKIVGSVPGVSRKEDE